MRPFPGVIATLLSESLPNLLLQAVAQFCVDSISAVPDDAVFAVQQQTEGAGSSVAVVWWVTGSSPHWTSCQSVDLGLLMAVCTTCTRQILKCQSLSHAFETACAIFRAHVCVAQVASHWYAQLIRVTEGFRP